MFVTLHLVKRETCDYKDSYIHQL